MLFFPMDSICTIFWPWKFPVANKFKQIRMIQQRILSRVDATYRRIKLYGHLYQYYQNWVLVDFMKLYINHLKCIIIHFLFEKNSDGLPYCDRSSFGAIYTSVRARARACIIYGCIIWWHPPLCCNRCYFIPSAILYCKELYQISLLVFVSDLSIICGTVQDWAD